jgi:DNA-binding response OmpR family regulator
VGFVVNKRALLAVLLLHENQVVSGERLLDELWGRRPVGQRTTREIPVVIVEPA